MKTFIQFCEESEKKLSFIHKLELQPTKTLLKMSPKTRAKFLERIRKAEKAKETENVK